MVGTFFNSFFENIAEKKIDLGSDTLKLMLTNTAPVVTNSVKTDITEISAGNGYTAGGATLTVTASAQTGGVYQLQANDVVFTASGGAIANFRYAVLWDDTATGDPLICFWDTGAAQSVTSGNNYTFYFAYGYVIQFEGA